MVGNLRYRSRVGFPESSYVRVGKRKTVSSRGCLDYAVFCKVAPYLPSSAVRQPEPLE